MTIRAIASIVFGCTIGLAVVLIAHGADLDDRVHSPFWIGVGLLSGLIGALITNAMED